MADEKEVLRSMFSLNFYHAVFHLTSILIPPLQKSSRAHPNYSLFSEYTEAQPLRKLMTPTRQSTGQLAYPWKFKRSTHQLTDRLMLSPKWFLFEAL